MDRETLLYTDADLWSAVYIGGPLFYSFARRGDQCGMIGANAAATLGGVAYWMGLGKFFSYTGAVRELPCDVLDYVFSDLNRTQKAKITATTLAQFGEVVWFYPSASQSGKENDRYVKVNVTTGAWDFGTLRRATGTDAGIFTTPMWLAPDGRLYGHESGQDRGGTPAFVESGPLEIGNGERVARVQLLIPDERTSGQVTATFYAADSPEDTERVVGPYTLTKQTDVRFEARQVRVRFAEPVLGGAYADNTHRADATIPASGFGGGADFRIGAFRLGVISGGRR